MRVFLRSQVNGIMIVLNFGRLQEMEFNKMKIINLTDYVSKDDDFHFTNFSVVDFFLVLFLLNPFTSLDNYYLNIIRIYIEEKKKTINKRLADVKP